jgi:RNase P subunit RPR2
MKKTETIEESFAKIAENSRVKVLEEENARLKAENERLRETIIRCPKCGSKLRLPKPKE